MGLFFHVGLSLRLHRAVGAHLAKRIDDPIKGTIDWKYLSEAIPPQTKKKEFFRGK
jgi:hypothetical protein